jgi:DNA primase
MEIQQIKSSLALSEVLRHYGLEPDNNQRLCCPFHDDKTPSMQVYAKTNTVYCFSANCKTHGKSLDVIDFIMHKENVSKHEAIIKATDLIGAPVPVSTSATSHINNKNHTTPAQTSASRTATLTKMFTHFKSALTNSKPARDYASSRNLDYKQLEIGYNTGQFHHGEKNDEVLINACVEVGLLQASSVKNATGGATYKAFGKYCLCFAMKDKAGKITGMYFVKAGSIFI